MNESIRDAVYDFAVSAIMSALSDGEDAIAEAKSLREGIRAGWSAALLDCGMPEENQAKLRFPL